MLSRHIGTKTESAASEERSGDDTSTPSNDVDGEQKSCREPVCLMRGEDARSMGERPFEGVGDAV